MEPMEISDNEADGETAATGYQVLQPNLDLEQYVEPYRGLARISRLLFIAEHCPSLKYDALVQALTYIREHTHNISMYNTVHQRLSQPIGIGAPAMNGNINGPVPPGIAGIGGVPAVPTPPDVSMDAAIKRVPMYDAAWIEQTQKKAAVKLEKLDTDLKHYKSNSIKESIRRGQDDLGEHYLDMGDLSNALKCFSRARDYCTNNRQIISMCFNVIKVSAFLNNWSLVLSYISRAENTPDIAQASGIGKDAAATARSQNISKLKCAAGLAELASRKYKAAAKHFLQANWDYLDYRDLISHSDVAKYGSLCALASFDRSELQRNVISNTTFKQFLEVEPQLNDILIKFYESNYASCLSLLDDIKDNLLLDMYLAPHVNTLYSMIRNRGLIQYFSPYLTADMRKMASAFNTTVTGLEEELMTLILDRQIKARIDSHNKILYAKDTDQRTSSFEKVLAVGREYEQRTKALVLRAAVHKAQIHVKCPPRGENAEAGGGGGGRPGGSGVIADVGLTPSHSNNSSPTPNN